jgi:cobalt-precorrin 5A hydrolase/precorrin-3B C17-methyltransferase
MNNSKLIWGLGFNQEAEGLLLHLRQAGLVDAIATVDAAPAEVLGEQWSQARGFVVVGACGLVTRLIAPLLQGKSHDPAVVVLDPQGQFAVPLLGGHSAGANRLSQQLAAALGGAAVLTGHSSGSGRLSLDSFGQDWGWRRGPARLDAARRRSHRDRRSGAVRLGSQVRHGVHPSRDRVPEGQACNAR